MPKKIFQIFIFSLLLQSGCSKSEETIFTEYTFRIQAELLDTVQVFPDLGIAIGIPKNFIQIPDSQVVSLQKQLQQVTEGNVPQYVPVKLFGEKEGNGILIISQIPKGQESFKEFSKSYNIAYRDFYPGSETDFFSHKKIKFWQGRRTDNKNLVYYRFLFDLEKSKLYIQIDYVFPLSINFGEIIETSIGTLQLNNQEVK